jgi:4-hydroxy-2-oxoheptanedioate aldolase
MRANLTKRLLADGKAAIGTFCTSSSALMAEAFGHAGFDYLMVDLQHGENELANLQAMLQAVSATPATPLVRVAANMPFYIQRALDLGAYGVIVPMVNTCAEAEEVVRSIRYAPKGSRSWGPVRGTLYGGADYFNKSHEELLTMVMLETADGLANAHDILTVEGIDGCFIGPNDLSLAMGYASELAELPAQVEEAIASILEATVSTGKAAGIQTFAAAGARARIKQGFRFISIQSDLRMARATAAQLIREILQ